MGKRLGLYVSLSEDGTLHRTLVSVSGETQLEPTTVAEEVILFSELSFYYYAFIVDRIKLSASYLYTEDTGGTPAVDPQAFEFIQDTVQDLIEEFEIDDPVRGTLTRTLIEDTVPEDDGTELYPLKTAKTITDVLSSVMEFQFTVNGILRNLRFKVPLNIEKKYPFLQEAEFVQITKFQNPSAPEYVFRTLVDYYTFLLLHFIAANPNVALCEYCCPCQSQS